MSWNFNITSLRIGFIAYQQIFGRSADKSCLVWKGTCAGICGSAFCHRFSCRIIIPVSSATPGRIWAGVYLPLSKIILIHNPFQMSYWLVEALLPFSIRGFYLQYIQKWSPNTCLPGSGRKDRDIWTAQTERDCFQEIEHCSSNTIDTKFCFMLSCLWNSVITLLFKVLDITFSIYYF